MPITQTSIINNLSFEQVIARLSQQEAVDGLLVIGSTSHDQLTPASDYDLVVILSEMPIPILVGVTQIDGRVADLVFCTTEQLDAILVATKPFHFWDWTGRLVGWLADGQIVFDRRGAVQRAQAKVKAGTWIEPVGRHEAYGPWQSINYNLQVVRRYLTSDDPTYLMAADLRMLIYGPQDLFWNYFTIRQLPPDSEKKKIQYLQEHDPEFLALFNRFLAEPDRHAKFHLYAQLAERVLAPVGPLWPQGATIMNVNAKVVTVEMEQQALDFWEALVESKSNDSILDSAPIE